MAVDDKTMDRMAKGKILGRFFIEILGTPKDHVKETMVKYVKNIKEDQNLEFVKEFIAEPEEKGKAFAVYAELEIWIKGMEKFFAFCLDAMPSSVEILEPRDFRLKSSTFSSMLNDLQAKLHEVDLVIKQLRVQNQTLDQNASALLQNFIMVSLRKTPKDPDQMGMEIGIKGKILKNILEKMVKDNLLELVDKKWYKIKNGKKEGKKEAG